MPRYSVCPENFREFCLKNPTLTNAEIGEHFHVTPQTVSNWRRIRNIPSTAYHDYSKIDAMISKGASTVEIVRATGWSKSSINKRKRDTGHGSGRIWKPVHYYPEPTDGPVRTTAEIIDALLEHKKRELHFNREQMAAWIGGPAYRQTLEDIAEMALPLMRRGHETVRV